MSDRVWEVVTPDGPRWTNDEEEAENARGAGATVNEYAQIPKGAHKTSDTSALGGDIYGPGGPYDRGQVIIDTRYAVLLEETVVSMVDNPSDGRRVASMLLHGRVNRATERTRVLYLFDADGAAAIVTELIGLAARAGGDYAAEFKLAVEHRMGEMP
jgi:hypothetical protein